MVDIPNDVMAQLIASGVKFDENGNITEDKFIESNDVDNDDDISDENEKLNDDSQEDKEIENKENDDDEDSDENEDDKDDEFEESDDEGEEDPEVKIEETEKVIEKNTSKPKLTPRKQKTEKEENNSKSEIDEIKNNIQILLDQSKKPNNENLQDEEDDISNAVLKLRKEIEDFQKLKLRLFADNIKNTVNSKNYGANYNDIISSEQWADYLNTSAYGIKIGSLYRNAIDEQNPEAMLFFFDDFSKKYLFQDEENEETDIKKQKKSSKKSDSLSDLAVPDKTKTTKTPKRSGYLYEKDDYQKTLEKFERGGISHKDFVEFDKNFTKALSAGKVKPS